MYIKCEICGEVFCGRSNSKYCSDECRKIARKKNKKEYDKKYYKANKDQIIEQKKEYYKANKDQIIEQKKEYYKANKDQILEQQKGYYKANKDQIIEQHKEYYKANKDQIIEQQKGYYKANRDQILKQQKEYNKEYYKTNKDQIIERQNEYHERKIRELTEQYPGDLKTILKQCPNIWMEREAKMQAWFHESYSEGIIKKIKTTPVCEVTGEKDNLVIHHLYSFNTHPELGNDPANMVRITKKIHKQFHTIYGYGNNTPEQWMEFIRND